MAKSHSSMIDDRKDFVPILVNPRAGSRGRMHRVQELAESLKQLGLRPELYPDRDVLVDVLKSEESVARCRCVVAAGGDGTVGWLINQNLAVPLAIFPVGSENLLARHFGITRRAEAAATMIWAGQVRLLDLGLANGWRFTVMASCGLDSEVVQRVHARRLGHVARWHYALALAGSLFQRNEPLSVWIDDEQEPLFAHHVFFFNVATYALGLPICTSGCYDDGLLDMVAFPGGGIGNLGRYFWGIAGPRKGELSDRICRRIRKARLDSPQRRYVQVDGDPGGQLPSEISVLPAALRLVVPHDSLKPVG